LPANRPYLASVDSSPDRLEHGDELRLREMTTSDLVRQALDELKLLVLAEVLHAREELRDELRKAKVVGILVGLAVGTGLCGLSVLFVGLAVAIPVTEGWALLLVAGVLLCAAALCAGLGYRRAPSSLLVKTRTRIKQDVALVRSTLRA
jgi:hypothetical protein